MEGAFDESRPPKRAADQKRKQADRRKRAELARLAGLDLYFFVLFAFAVAFSAFATECFFLCRATAFATSSAESLLCFSECNTSVRGPEFVAIA